MKKIVIIGIAILVIAIAVAQAYAQPGVIYPTPLSDWAAGYTSVPGGYGYYGYGGYYGGWVSENVKIRSEERWGPQGGERSYRQEPSIPAKLIDAGTLLGIMGIIFR